ncbi:hypothetical protein EVAR_34493_1 [Eumeta japonica]|uniref:Uncharacterized protein n=1 Tax=Eumeta variegata TaxID=151549 RepID=A0A4C1WUB6_EUMVA|nr:hypothetical protein EVAR_34493_1 [Eumeta japonica]
MKGRWSEIRKQCKCKSIVILDARNTARDIKIQPVAIPDFRNLSALLATLKVAYYTYSLKKEREFWVVLQGVPKKLPTEEVKETPCSGFSVHSVCRITNRAHEPHDRVLVTANTSTVHKATK